MARSQPANRKPQYGKYGFQTLPERPPLRAGIGNVKFKECLYFLSEARRLGADFKYIPLGLHSPFFLLW